MIFKLSVLALVGMTFAASGAVLRHSGAECKSDDAYLGNFSFASCVENCQLTADCKFFLFGTGWKVGRCWHEKTADVTCPEGWEDDLYDFYEMLPDGKQGCMVPQASNYDPTATVDDQSCLGASICAGPVLENGNCESCTSHGCDFENHGYRNPANST